MMNLFPDSPSTVSKSFTLAFLINFCVNFCIHEIVQGLNVKPQKENYLPNYQIYHNLTELEKVVMNIANRNPNYVKVDSLYKSRKGRLQLVIHLTNFTGSSQVYQSDMVSKLKVLFSYGEHAREFLPVESMLFFLQNITNGLTANPGSYEENFTRTILSKASIYIIAMSNPDGRHHVERTQNFCWRGTSTGVDLDRNFDWEFGGKGSSGDPNDEEYRGKTAFSEPECGVFRDLTTKHDFDAFVSFHSGVKQIYIPYADTKSKMLNRKPEYLEDLMDLASQLSTSTQYVYKYGLAYQLNQYTADGTIFDYMAGTKKIPFSLTIELWGKKHQGPSCFDLFNPPNDQLTNTLETIHPIYIKLFSFLIDWKSTQAQRLSSSEAPSLALGYLLLLLLVGLTLILYFQGRFPFFNRYQQRRRIVSLKSLGSTFSVSFMKS